MTGEIKMVAFLVGGLSFIGTLLATVYPEWIKNSQVSSQQYLMNQYVYQGIWWRCSSNSPGTFVCDSFDVSFLAVTSDIQASRALMCLSLLFSFPGIFLSLLSLDCTTMVTPYTKIKNRTSLSAGGCFLLAADLQAQRAFMIIGIVVSLFGLVIGMISLRCTTMIENDSKPKAVFGIVCGCCFLLSGLTCGGAVSWFAWRVTYEFYNPLYQHNAFKYEFGTCLYVGWASMILSLISALILIIGSCKNMKKTNTHESYTPTTIYKPPVNTATNAEHRKTEYV